jgi:hypothetical protein
VKKACFRQMKVWPSYRNSNPLQGTRKRSSRLREIRYREFLSMRKKTISIRMDDEDYRFLSVLAKGEREDFSKKVRELVDLGRVMLAIEKYKKSEASIERAARIAGVSVSKMMDILHEHNVEMNLERGDYLKGLNSLRETW